MKIDLNGKWQFKEADGGEIMEAVVPSTNYGDLLRLQKIPDPFTGVNEKDVWWVAERDWIYSRSFKADKKLLSYDAVFLVAKQLDTVCEVYLNGSLIGRGENCHIAHRFDVKPFLKAGENHIEIKFYSPVKYVKEMYAKQNTPPNSNGLTGIVHIRKPQCHFGWDWGPALPVSGITDDIYIEAHARARIRDYKVEQIHSDGKVTLRLECAAESFFEDCTLKAAFSVKCPDGNILSAESVAENGLFTAEIEILNPELWWTREISGRAEQPLYEVVFGLYSDAALLDGRVISVGLRTIRLNREKDAFGQNFCFELNGVKIFAKGANLIPPDSLITRFSEADLDKLLEAAVFGNFNMLRVWGGGYYASEALLDRCDRLGILVWQDFAFACQAYPFFMPEFEANVLAEIDGVVKRMRHRACLALWCGNNEIEQMAAAWLYMKNYVDWTEKFFYHILPEKLRALDGRSYTAGSPVGIKHMRGVNNDNVGDTHLWAVWHGLQPLTYYRKRLTRFCSEFGFESLPDIKTIKSYAEEKDFSLTSEVFNAHQKCNGGNQKMRYYIASRFRLPLRFTDYIYLSQICQSECVRDASEHWRRNKGRCNGSLFWQFNDCWPVCSWSSLDYFGRYKALQYTAKRFFAPLALSLENTDGGISVFTLNDTLNNYNAELTLKVCDFDGKVLIERNKSVEIQPNTSQNHFCLGMANVRPLKRPRELFAVAEMIIDGETAGRATVLFVKEKRAKLPHADIKKEVEIQNGEMRLTLISDKFARFVMLENALSSAPFSDNFFDLLPDVPVTVTQKLDTAISKEEALNAVAVFSAADLSAGGNAFTDFLTRAAVFFKPINFFSRLYMRRIPKNISDRAISKINKENNL